MSELLAKTITNEKVKLLPEIQDAPTSSLAVSSQKEGQKRKCCCCRKKLTKCQKAAAGIFGTILSIVAVILLIAIIYVPPHSLNVDLSESKITHERYFRDIVAADNRIANMPVNEIPILGSHDSTTYDFSGKSIQQPGDQYSSSVATIPTLPKWVVAFARGLLIRFGKCQIHDIYTQLKHGARYVDIRPATNGPIKKFWSSHFLLTDSELSHYLLDVMRFLDENPGEFVIVNFVHIYKHKAITHNDIFEYLETVKRNGKNFLEYIKYVDKMETDYYSDITYNDVTNGGTEGGIVLTVNEFIYIEPDFRYWKYIPQSYYIRSAWHNKIFLEDIFDGVVGEVAYLGEYKEHFSRYLKINQVITSVVFNGSLGEIFASVFCWSILRKARYLLDKVLEDGFYLEDWMGEMSILHMDYITSPRADGLVEKIAEYAIRKSEKYYS